MFRGINAINLDPKGRMAVPTRYREQLNEGSLSKVILTIETEASCLLLYPLKEWNIVEAKIATLSSFNPATRRIQRLLIGHATEVELDSNGRILIPTLLREYAHLNKSILLVGQSNKFEIWDEQSWMSGRAQWLAEESKISTVPEDLQHLTI